MALLQEIKVPLLSVNDTTLTVIEILFKTGSKVKKNDILMVFETSKTTYDVVAEFEGYIHYESEAGKDYEVNEVVARVFSEPGDIPADIKSGLNGKPALANLQLTPVVTWEGETLFSKEAILLMEKNGYDKTAFKTRDFVSREDVEEQFGLKPPEETPVRQAEKKPAKPSHPPSDAITFTPISSNKKREIEYLSAVQSTGLTSTIHTTIDTFGIFLNTNKSLKYLKNSLLPLVIYECSRLLHKYPLLNAFFNEDSIGVYEQVNIGFAIDADKGLKVLNINGTSNKNLYEIEEDIMSLSDLYFQDKLTVDSLTNITFTITDLSSLGVSSFQPLVNMNNSAILGISAIDEKFNRCNLSITFDHRITEGKSVALFLRELKDRIETYKSLNSKEDFTSVKCFKCHKSLAEDLSGIGFVKCITTTGSESYVCQSCFKGF